jgi:DNA polymerase-3 subunit gamma/tau
MVRGINLMSQVLALKYRPKRFEDLIGQSTVSQTLSLALDTNRLSHAYLLSGLRGSGKTSTARILAKSFLCDNGPTSNPCDMCSNCVSANDGKHLDIIEMDAASNRGIEDIKDLIEHMKYKPSSARYKVFIIDEIHMLTPQAFNALLKTLEEPPAFVKFILATTDPLKLPATILSRTQHFRFNKIAQNDVVNHLIHILNLENIKFEESALEILSRSGQGSLRDTLTMLDQAIIFSKGEVTTSSVVDMLGLVDPKVLEELFTKVLLNDDISDMIHILNGFEPTLIIDEMTLYLKDKMLKRDSKFTILLYDRYFRILADAKQLLYINSDGEFVLMLTLMKLQEANNIKTIDDILDEIESIEVTNTNVSKDIINQESNIEVQVENTAQIKTNTIINEKSNTNSISYETEYIKLTESIYEKSYDLGECFEKSFKFISFIDNILLIGSTAQGECRKQLHKNFAHIRSMSEDIFGDDIDIEFEKIKDVIPEEVNVQDEINAGSSCMQNTIETPIETMTDAQYEYQIEDIEHSEMFNNAKELFKPTKIVVTSKA